MSEAQAVTGASRQEKLLTLLNRLERLERVSSGSLRAAQDRQLRVLHRHLALQSPAYAERLRAADLDPCADLGLADLPRLPPLRRRELQRAGEALFCRQVPGAHLPLGETRTSGSSGEPVVVRRSALSQLFWYAYTLREHLWWQRDPRGCLAVLRANLPQPRLSQGDWGPPLSLVARTGAAHAFSMALDSATLAREIAAVAPDYLLVYPNALRDLLREWRENATPPHSIKQIRSIGETLPDSLRQEVREQLGVTVVDTYSSQELGVIAIQCPHSGLYHLMAENLVVEVLDAEGRPCAEGETGELVVTDLHNFATPLVRYAIGDHAEVGPACTCGRNLPTLRRIHGRSRNMALYPDGSRRWPRVGFDRYRDVAPVSQYQLIQHAAEAIEVRLVTERPLSEAEEAALGDIIRSALGHPFRLDFRYFDARLPSGPGGKFEEFVRTWDA